MSMANTRKAASRKDRSERFLRNNGVNIDPALPEIITAADARIKPPEEAVKRAVCAFFTSLTAVGVCNGNGGEAAKICADPICRFGLENELTADERRYFSPAGENPPAVSVKEAEEFHRRTEMSMPLLWACGFLGENDLEFPSHETDIDELWNILNSCKSFSEVMAKVNMHTADEILDNADVCMRMNWACTEASLRKAPFIRGDLMPETVRGQFMGFCWLIGIKGAEDWDNIDLDRIKK